MTAYPHTRRGRQHRRSALAAAALLTVFSLTACGGGEGSGGGGDRPSAEDIEGQITQSSGNQVTEKQAACLAKTYYESDLSDEAVRLLVEAEDVSKISPEDLSEADQKASKELYEPLVKCLSPAE